MRHLGSLRLSFAVLAFVVILADCGGGGGGGGVGGVLPSTGGGTTLTLSVGSANAYMSDTGQIASVISGGFTMQDATKTVTVYTKKSTNNYGPSVAVGVYAMVVGTAGTSSSIDAIAVSTATTAFGTVTASGPVSGWDVTDGFTIHTTSGYLNIFVLPGTTVNGSTTIRVGEQIQATGIGSLSTQIAASTITVGSTSPTPSPTGKPTTQPTAIPTPTATPTPTPSGVPTLEPTTGPVIAVPSGVSTWAGPFVGSISGGFEIHTPYGYANVYTNGNTVVKGTLKVGQYVQATGTGTPSTKFTGQYVSAYSTQPGTTTAAGTVAAQTGYGFTLNAGGSYTAVPVVLNSSTIVAGASLAVGTSVQVTGAGAESASIIAAQIVVAQPTAPPTPTPAPISQTHVLTADYLGSPWGSTSISWAAAAPFLSWAEVSPANSSAVHATGIKTQLYGDATLSSVNSPMYAPTESAFAHDCNGNRITTSLDGTTLYLMDVTSPSLQAAWQQYTASTGGAYDAVFEDDDGPLTDDTSFRFSAMPCNYSDAAWMAGDEAVNQASALPVIFNGLAATGGQPVSPSISLLSGSNVVGAEREGCYTSPSIIKEDGSLWQAEEDTEIDVATQHKFFECYADGPGSSGSNTDARLYVFASFLLTYDPSTTTLWDRFTTTTGFEVNPETALVALDPKVPEPSEISALQQSGGTYGREYGQCYLRGQFVGACAVVVNPDSGSSHLFPFPQYTHTLVLSGSGVLDGGTVSVSGPPPPEYLGADEAAVVFP